jgi:hypothetical protein
VLTARYGLSPYITQIHFVLRELKVYQVANEYEMVPNNTNFSVDKHAAWNSVHNCLFYELIFVHSCLTLSSLKAMTP